MNLGVICAPSDSEEPTSSFASASVITNGDMLSGRIKFTNMHFGSF